jgi:hypothetical protein
VGSDNDDGGKGSSDETELGQFGVGSWLGGSKVDNKDLRHMDKGVCPAAGVCEGVTWGQCENSTDNMPCDPKGVICMWCRSASQHEGAC